MKSPRSPEGGAAGRPGRRPADPYGPLARSPDPYGRPPGTPGRWPADPYARPAATPGRRPPDRYPGAYAAPGPAPREAAGRGTVLLLAGLSLAGIGISMALIGAVSLLGPSAAVPQLPSAFPWPLFYLHAQPGTGLVTWSLWLAVLAAAAGVTAGLLAVRRGWQPRARLLVAGSLIAVLGLMLLPPVGSKDLLDDAVYGRIAAQGYSPYQMTPAKYQQTGDPMAALATRFWSRDPSPYGPLMTVTQEAASKLGGDNGARTMFWLKAWNALAFLAIALALNRLLRSDPRRRTRAHLLWTANPLMLLAVMAGGHNDVLGAVFGVLALAAFRRADFMDGLLAGVLAGTAVVLKAPFALIGAGLVVAAIRAPRALSGLALGAVAVIVPTYAIAGKQAITAVVSKSGAAFDAYQPWQLLARIVPSLGSVSGTNALTLAVTVVLAAVLLWRMPAGPAEFAAVRPALALMLAWLICSPLQRTWYDVMIFPLLALMPASRLDWIVLARAGITAIGQLPGVTSPATIPLWLERDVTALNEVLVPGAIVVLAATLAWLCLTGRIAGSFAAGHRARAAPRHATLR